MTTYQRDGGRLVELFLPFEHDGKAIDSIKLAAVTFGDTLAWQRGEYKTVLSLMAKKTNMSEECLRDMRYPDVDRVMAVFIDMLPPEIRETIGETQNQEQPPLQDVNALQAQQPMTNGKDTNHPLNEAFADPADDPLGLGVKFDEDGNAASSSS